MNAKEEEALDRAWEALEEDAVETALELSSALEKAHPDDEVVAELRVRALEASGREDDALALLYRWEKRSKEAWPFVAHAELVLRIDDEGAEEALEVLKQASKRAKNDAPLEAEIAWLEGTALVRLEEDAHALKAYDRALKAAPDHLDARLDRGILRFELSKFALAKEDLEPLTRGELENAEAWHNLGLIAEREGDAQAAKKAFASARRLAPEAFAEPISLSETEFDAAVKDALKKLPDFAKEQMDNVVISVQPIPTDEDLDGGALSPAMLGIFKGTPHGLRSVSSGADHATAHIVLFQKNLERAVRSRDELIEQIGITVAHEVGHLLGLDENDLKDRGLD